jgi:hypothetical protein
VIEVNRWRVEYVLASIFAVLGLVTAVVPDWIEAVFKVNPDAGNGGIEWIVVTVFGVLALVAAVYGWRDYRAAARQQ